MNELVVLSMGKQLLPLTAVQNQHYSTELHQQDSNEEEAFIGLIDIPVDQPTLLLPFCINITARKCY